MFGRPERGKEKSPAWLIIFGDLAALLLTFFVMMFSMTDIPSERWEAVVATLSTSFDATPLKAPVVPQAPRNIATVELEAALPISYLSAVLTELLAEDDILKDALLRPQANRLVVSLPGHVLFAPGKAELDERGRQALFRLGGVIAQTGNQIEVRGHSDPTTADGVDFVSAWRLSLSRAMAVAQELAETGYERDIVVLGLGDSRYKHLSATLTDERRRQLSRRVDVVIYETAAEQ